MRNICGEIVNFKVCNTLILRDVQVASLSLSFLRASLAYSRFSHSQSVSYAVSYLFISPNCEDACGTLSGAQSQQPVFVLLEHTSIEVRTLRMEKDVTVLEYMVLGFCGFLTQAYTTCTRRNKETTNNTMGLCYNLY